MDEATAGTSAGQMSQASIRGTVEGWSPELVGCTSRQIFNVSCVDVLYVCVCWYFYRRADNPYVAWQISTPFSSGATRKYSSCLKTLYFFYYVRVLSLPNQNSKTFIVMNTWYHRISIPLYHVCIHYWTHVSTFTQVQDPSYPPNSTPWRIDGCISRQVTESFICYLHQSRIQYLDQAWIPDELWHLSILCGEEVKAGRRVFVNVMGRGSSTIIVFFLCVYRKLANMEGGG